MKSIFYTFLFLVFSFPAVAQFSEMLALTPEESARLDSTMQEISNLMQEDSFQDLPEEELKAIFLNAINQVLPADKAAALQQLLIPEDNGPGYNEQPPRKPEDYAAATEMPYPHLLLSRSQFKLMDDFEVKLYRKQDATLTTNAAEAIIEEHLYSILNEEQKIHFFDYQRAIEKHKIDIQRRTLKLIIPGFELNDAETLKLIRAEGERQWITSHNSYPDQITMRRAYRAHLEKIVDPEKLRQYDDLTVPLDREYKPILLQNDSSTWFNRYQQMTGLYAWSETNLKPLITGLQSVYGKVVPQHIAGKLDSLRQMENTFRAFRTTTGSAEFHPWEVRYKTLEANYLQQFPNINLTIDQRPHAGEPLKIDPPSNFRVLRNAILGSFDWNAIKDLSAALVEVENIQKGFMQQSTPNLVRNWFPVYIQPSVATQNRILNFLLSMPDK